MDSTTHQLLFTSLSLSLSSTSSSSVPISFRWASRPSLFFSQREPLYDSASSLIYSESLLPALPRLRDQLSTTDQSARRKERSADVDIGAPTQASAPTPAVRQSQIGPGRSQPTKAKTKYIKRARSGGGDAVQAHICIDLSPSRHACRSIKAARHPLELKEPQLYDGPTRRGAWTDLSCHAAKQRRRGKGRYSRHGYRRMREKRWKQLDALAANLTRVE